MATAIQKFKGEANRAKVVNLRLAGKTQEAIAAEMGFADSSAVRYHLKTWVESIAPPAERAQELRETWGGRLETAHEKIWPLVQEGDPKAIETMLKIQAQAARLFGLELQPSMQVSVITAEAMVDLFRLDAGAPAIDVEATEGTTDGA